MSDRKEDNTEINMMSYIEICNRYKELKKEKENMEENDKKNWKFLFSKIGYSEVLNIFFNTDVCQQEHSSILKKILWDLFDTKGTMDISKVNRIFFFLTYCSVYYNEKKPCNCSTCTKPEMMKFKNALISNRPVYNPKDKKPFELENFFLLGTGKKPFRDIFALALDMMIHNFTFSFEKFFFEVIMRNYEKSKLWCNFDKPEESDSLMNVLKMCNFVYVYIHTRPEKIPENKAIYFNIWKHVITEFSLKTMTWEEICQRFGINYGNFCKYFSKETNDRFYEANHGKMSKEQQEEEKKRMAEIKRRRRLEEEAKAERKRKEEEEKNKIKELILDYSKNVTKKYSFLKRLPKHILIQILGKYITSEVLYSESKLNLENTEFFKDCKVEASKLVHSEDFIETLFPTNLSLCEGESLDNNTGLDNDDTNNEFSLDDVIPSNEFGLNCFGCSTKEHQMMYSPYTSSTTQEEQKTQIREHIYLSRNRFCPLCGVIAVSHEQFQEHLNSPIPCCRSNDWAKLSNARCTSCGKKDHVASICWKSLCDEEMSEEKKIIESKANDLVKSGNGWYIKTIKFQHMTEKKKDGTPKYSFKPLHLKDTLEGWEVSKDRTCHVVNMNPIQGNYTILFNEEVFTIKYHLKNSFKAVSNRNCNYWKSFKKDEYGKTWELRL